MERFPKYGWWRWRFILLLLASATISASHPTGGYAQNQDEEALPKLEEMEVPSAEDLLKKPPVDWIVLKNDDVIVVEPVRPRPDTLKKLEQMIEDLKKQPRPKTDEERQERNEKLRDLYYLPIYLPGGGETPEYEIQTKNIKQIIYHEELKLRRVDAYLQEGKLKEAFEILFRIEREHPNWPHLKERKNRIIFAEAKAEAEFAKADADAELKQQHRYSALVLLEELYGRDPKFPGLNEAFGGIMDQLISEAIIAKDFPRARHFVDRLRRRNARHAVAVKWTADLKSRAATLLNSARDASKNGRHDVAALRVQQAVHIWPVTTPRDKDTYARITHRYQRLGVGVVRLAGEKSAYFLPTDADRRHEGLSNASLFEIDRTDDAAHYGSAFFEQWEPNDLGRRTVFTLRQTRPYWETLPIVTSTSVVSTLKGRLDPSSPEFDERFAGYVDSLTIRSPFQFVVQFGRVPLRIEALFNFPVLASSPGRQQSLSVDKTRLSVAPPILTQRFRLQTRDGKHAVYRRVVAEPDDVGEYHVAEIVETKYADRDLAAQGLLRGEVSMLPSIRSWNVTRFRSDNRFYVKQYALPVTHVLQFNPQSKPLMNDQLRRALVYALPRRRILAETVLRDPELQFGRVVSAPFPSRSNAYSSRVRTRKYNLTLANSLAFAARKPLGGKIPNLKMVCVPDPVVEAAAARLISQWAIIGINVRLVKNQGGTPNSNWDIVYRTVRMADPLVELWPFLTLDSRARVESLAFLPDWLRQEMIELDNAGDWNTALEHLHRLHRQLNAEIQLIPLWEVDEFYLIRKNINQPRLNTFETRLMHPYHSVERWIIR